MRNKRRHREKRPIRLGVMQTEKTRYETPSFQRALVAAGLIDETTTKDVAWYVWQGVCRDSVVIRLSMALETSKKVFLPSVASPFSNGTRVLQAMNERQISALKQRIGA
jgi:hypothetical protein